MNSKMILGQYYNTDSFVHRLDPRTKLISLFILMISIFLITNIYYLLVMTAVILCFILLSKIPLKRFFNSFKMMTFILLFTVVFQILFTQTGDLLVDFKFDMTISNLVISVLLLVIYFVYAKFVNKFKTLVFLLLAFASFYLQHEFHYLNSLFTYSITVYDDGLFFALKIVFRIINLISISSLLTFTTKPTDLTSGIESLAKPLKFIGVNTSIMAMMISIAIRFIPTLINEANRILKAQASRGVDFKESKFNDKIVQIISLLIPMIVIAYKRAEDLANAMEARGYIPGAQRTSLNVLKLRRNDYLTIAVTLCILTFTIAINFI